MRLFDALAGELHLLDSSLSGGQTGDGHTEGRAGHIVQADPVAELHRGGVAAMLAARQQAPTCSENMPVTRYDLDREQKLAAKDSEIALLKANTYNDGKMLEVYGYIDRQLKDVRETLCKQAVHNQRTEDSFTLVKQDVESVRKEALDAIKMEAERRCCGDNSIVTYVNATFYPKQVADVTTGTATTAQTLYNPIQKCGGCCNS